MREAIRKIMEHCPPDFSRLNANIVLLTGRIDDLLVVSPRMNPLPIADSLERIYRLGITRFYAYAPIKGLRILYQKDQENKSDDNRENNDISDPAFDISQIINTTMINAQNRQRNLGKGSDSVGRFVNQPGEAIAEIHKILQQTEKVFVCFEYLENMHFHSGENAGFIQSLLNDLPGICEKNNHLTVFSGKTSNADLDNVYPPVTQKVLRVVLQGPAKTEIQTVLLREEFTQRRQIVRGNVFDQVVEVMFSKGKSPENGLKTLRDNLICRPDACFDEAWIKENGAPVLDFSSLDLEDLRWRLKENLIGQELPKQRIMEAMKDLKAFGNDPKKGTLLNMLFAGPSGVGKTELTKILADFIFSTSDSMLFVDGTTYIEKHEVAKLLGSPPGYVGYGEPGALESHRLKYPCGVILFDEFEKMHNDIQKSILGLLEEGVITSPRGERIDFSQYIIVATTNAGKKEVDESGYDFINADSRAQAYLDALKKEFPTELLGRFDHRLVFDFLSESQMKEVAKLYVNKFLTELSQKPNRTKTDLSDIEITDSFYIKVLITADRQMGARNIKGIVEKAVKKFWRENILSDNQSEKLQLTENYIV